MHRKWLRWALAAGAGAIVLAVGVPFVYIHFIEGSPPPPLRLSSGAPTTGAVSTTSVGAAGATTTVASPGVTRSGVDGTWTVTAGSQTGYRIKETLFGQSNTAVGRTSAVTGSISIAGTTVQTGTFSVDLTKVTSDQSQRDHQFQGRIMDTATFPTAKFALTRPIQLASLPADGVQIAATATGTLTMHGVTRPVTFQLTARHTGGTIEASGQIPITFADWNISNPSGGPATTEDHGTLEFLLVLAPG